MTVVERIEQTLKEKHINKGLFLSEMGLTVNSFKNWKERGTSPKADMLPKIAEYLGVSVSFLLGEDVDGLSELDKQLIEAFRELPDNQKFALLALIKNMKG